MDVLLRPVGSDEDIDLNRVGASKYRDNLSDMLAHHTRRYDEWSDLTTHHFLLSSFENKDLGLLFERPDMEIRDGELWCVVVAGLKHTLTEQEREFLQLYIEGGISDGWGEDIPWAQSPDGALHPILYQCTEVRQQARGELTLTEQQEFQLQAPRNTERLLNTTGFIPDFEEKWEYEKHQPIWLEVSADRKTVRVPLPAPTGELDNARNQIGRALLHYRLQVPRMPLLEISLSDQFNLEELNTLAKCIRTQSEDIMEQTFNLLRSRTRPKGNGMITAFHQALEEITSNTLDEALPELNRPSM